MSGFVNFVVSTGGLTSGLLLGALWLWRRPGSPRPRRFLLALAVVYLLASVYGVSYAIGRVLALGFERFDAHDRPPGRMAIVLLGSGGITARDWDGNRLSIVDPSAAARVLEAARVFALVDPEWIISSGGKRDGDPDEPSGLSMRDALVRLGVPPSRILVETESQTTRTEALVVAPMLRSLGVAHTILVTSDTHMRRSLGTFRAAGVDAIPAIARHPYNHVSWDGWLLPSNGGLEEARLVVHELLGIAYYTVRGWYR